MTNTNKNIPPAQKILEDAGLKRGLKNRHVQIIALGGIIGSGFFLGTGEIVNLVGPSAFIAYILGGLIVYLTMLCMGELAVAIPISGSFITYTSEFISPIIACGVGWSYWISWVAFIPAECIAGGIIMQHFTGINGYLWAVLFGLLITYINISKVGTFGEIEFWMGLIKITSLVCFVLLAILIFFGIIHGKNQPADILWGKYLFHQGGLFPNGVHALLLAMVLLLVNYQGTEIIGLAAGESEDPATMFPQTIDTLTFRILMIYIIPVFFLVLIYPWHLAGLKNSVFADALAFYDLKWAGTAVSLATLTASFSCSNSGVYGIVRSLYALARNGMAPHVLSQLNSNAVPKNAAVVTLIAIWFLLIVSYFFGQTRLYIALLVVSGFTGAIAWISLCWAQINFRKRLYKAGYSTDDLHYKTPGSPYTGVIAIILMIICLFLLALNKDSVYQIAFIIGLISFFVPILIYLLHIWFKKKFYPLLPKRLEKHFDSIFPPK